MKSKDKLRKEIWTRLQKNRVARFPGAEGRIPNFTGAEACARALAQTSWWQKAKVLKVNPDSPQRPIRQKALSEGKILYMAVPRLHSEKPFIELDPKPLTCSPYVPSSTKGAARYTRPVSLAAFKTLELDFRASVATIGRGAR